VLEQTTAAALILQNPLSSANLKSIAAALRFIEGKLDVIPLKYKIVPIATFVVLNCNVLAVPIPSVTALKVASSGVLIVESKFKNPL
jgi:hypothetical protein